MPPPLTQTMYIRYTTKQLAKQASSDLWVRLLGRPYDPKDATQFIFGTLGCLDGGWDYLVLTEPLFSQLYPLLTTQEKNFVDTNMVDVNNVQVQSCLNSLPKPPNV